uniref:Uncharacterized protein n=1 Tax=Haptolina brevifila TaxID=156173 RepID=A0A7S2HHW3_9EUKA|mmetsp:Transcript_54843/g.108922  ORF Transcript_54843/g.108922 Transcript_54843/m.108922 type:complete len:149 (+) Transcript_54843:66-512(+)
MASLVRTCAFDSTDLQRAASAASSASPLRLPSSPGSPTHSAIPPTPRSPSSKRIAFCPTTTVLLFDRTLDGGKIPSDAAAPLGLGALRATVVWPLLTEEPVCPYTRRRPGAMPGEHSSPLAPNHCASGPLFLAPFPPLATQHQRVRSW